MSSEIYFLPNGRASMATKHGTTTWHHDDNIMAKDAKMDIWIKTIFDWTINASKMTYLDHNGISRIIPDKIGLYRSDDGGFLSVVSNRYKVVQPHEVLEFFRDLVESYGFELETAGSLNGGRRFWALAKTSMNIDIKGDKVENYLCVVTSCDGSMATQAFFTSIRVVCANTLRMALNQDGKNAVIVRHSTVFNPDQVKIDLGIIRNNWSEFGDIITAMSEYKVSRKETADIIYNLFKTDKAASIEDESTRTQNIMRGVFASVANSPGSHLQSADGTAWGLLNGVTHYIDHEAGARSDDNRLNSAWFGKGNDIKNQAYDLVKELISANQQRESIPVTDIFPDLTF